jgi:hypothetical protein
MNKSDKIVKQNQAVLSGVKESVKTITGGDSFARLILLHTDGKNHFTVILAPIGKYPLHALNIRSFSCTTLPETPQNLAADVERGEQTATIGDLPAPVTHMELSFPDDTNGINCHAMFTANNGYWNQILQLRIVNGVWKTAEKIVRGNLDNAEGKVLVNYSDEGYPKEPDGSIKWFMLLKH